LRGGVRLLQYRDKSGDEARRQREAQALAELCARHGAALIINDDLELAAHLGVGLHLGQEDGSLAIARERLGPQAIVGATCHAQLTLAERAIEDGASYVAFGRFFNSNTKPGAPAADDALLQQTRARFRQPIVAIGGITLDTAPRLIAQGADLIAVMHALVAADSAADVVQGTPAFSRPFPIPAFHRRAIADPPIFSSRGSACPVPQYCSPAPRPISPAASTHRCAPSAASAAHRCSSSTPRAPTSSTRMTSAMSTTSAPGAR